MKIRKLTLLLTPALAIIAATGCVKPTAEGLSLYDDKSILIGTAKIDPENPTQSLPELKENILTAPLATYRLSTKGDVPYVEASQLASALNTTLQFVTANSGVKVEVKDKILHIKSKDDKGELVLDAKEDTVKLKSSPSFTLDVTMYNNNVPGDYVSFRGNSIQESSETRVYKEDGSAVPEYETYSFRDYGFDIYEKDDKYYLPFEAVTKLMYRDIGLDFAYNGKEFYINELGKFIQTRAYSSNGYFKNYIGVFAPSKNKGPGEAYRFYYPYQILKEGSDKETERATRFLVLNEGGSGYFVSCRGEELDTTKAITDDQDASYIYTWTKVGDILNVKISNQATGEETTPSPLGEYQIHLDETRFLKGTVSRETSDYNYNILRFLFDNIYGLKAIKGYSNADAYFTTLGVKNGLKNTNASEYNKALAALIGNVDDGHSNFTQLQLATKYEETADLPDLIISNRHDRVRQLYSVKSTYDKARIDKYKELHPDDINAGNTDPLFYQGMRFSDNKETAVITFDAFTHPQPAIQNMRELFPIERNWGDSDEEIKSNVLISTRAMLGQSSPDGFSSCFDALKFINKNSKVVKNVVVDLTNNGGGMIAVLPYLEAFFSDKPTYVLKDTVNNTIREYHYKVDLNGDGTFGGEGDTFKGQFNFFFLTSKFSFSCGNYFPGFAKNNGVKIIGEQSGGGTSPVGVFMDALGSGINLSNYTNMMYKDANGKWTQNDSGIPVDYSFPLQNGNWYDPNAINTFINSIQNN